MRSKFKKGDKIRLNGQVPKHMQEDIPRKRTRTIAATWYCHTEQHTYYNLAGRGKTPSNIWVRAEALKHAVDPHKIGRPRKKRQYNHKGNGKLRLEAPNQNLQTLQPLQIAQYLDTAKNPLQDFSDRDLRGERP